MAVLSVAEMIASTVGFTVAPVTPFWATHELNSWKGLKACREACELKLRVMRTQAG